MIPDAPPPPDADEVPSAEVARDLGGPLGLSTGMPIIGRRLGMGLRAHMPGTGHFWLTKLSPTGRVLLIVLILVGAGAPGLGIYRPLYYFASFLLCLFVIDHTLGLLLRPRPSEVKIDRILPDRCAAGSVVTVRTRIENVGSRPLFDLAVSERRPPPPCWVGRSPYQARLDPGETIELAYPMIPSARGAHDFESPALLTAFPFGMHHAGTYTDGRHRLLAYPSFGKLGTIDLPVGTKHQPGGLALVSRVGESEEFIGNRDYLPGDRLRDLDQRAWARLGRPVVREFQQEYLCRIALIVDTFVPKKRDQEAVDAFEAAISLGAAVADAVSRLEYVIDLFAVGPDLYHLQAGRSLAYLDSILDILACIESCPTSPFHTLGPAIQEELGQISTAVVVLLDWDEERARFVETLRQCGVAERVLVVRHGEPTLDPSGAAGAAGPPKVLTPSEARSGMERL